MNGFPGTKKESKRKPSFEIKEFGPMGKRPGDWTPRQDQSSVHTDEDQIYAPTGGKRKRGGARRVTSMSQKWRNTKATSGRSPNAHQRTGGDQIHFVEMAREERTGPLQETGFSKKKTKGITGGVEKPPGRKE